MAPENRIFTRRLTPNLTRKSASWRRWRRPPTTIRLCTWASLPSTRRASCAKPKTVLSTETIVTTTTVRNVTKSWRRRRRNRSVPQRNAIRECLRSVCPLQRIAAANALWTAYADGKVPSRFFEKLVRPPETKIFERFCRLFFLTVTSSYRWIAFHLRVLLSFSIIIFYK